MDQQQKVGDTAVETIAKTVPGEFVSLIVLLKTFLDNDWRLLFVGLIVSPLVPIYAARILRVVSWPQRILMLLSYLAWLFMLVPDGVDNALGLFFSTPYSLKDNVKLFAALVLVLQFAIPFLTTPVPSKVVTPPAPK